MLLRHLDLVLVQYKATSMGGMQEVTGGCLAISVDDCTQLTTSVNRGEDGLLQ